MAKSQSKACWASCGCHSAAGPVASIAGIPFDVAHAGDAVRAGRDRDDLVAPVQEGLATLEQQAVGPDQDGAQRSSLERAHRSTSVVDLRAGRMLLMSASSWASVSRSRRRRVGCGRP